MTRNEILRRYPNASESMIRKNLCEDALEGHSLPPRSLATASEGVKGVKIAKSTDEGKLNRLEASFLFWLRVARPPWIGIQNMTLKLADDVRYTPDFMTVDEAGGLVAWECKGWMRDDARVKLRVAARQFPFIKFVLVTKMGGTFKREEVKP